MWQQIPPLAWTALIALLTLAVLWALGRAWRRYKAGQVTVYDTEAGLKLVDGKVAAVLKPGRYSTWPEDFEIQKLDLRENAITVSGQEMLTADALAVRLSVVVRYRVANPVRARAASVSPVMRLHEAVQVVLRERVGAKALDELIAARAALMDGFAHELEARVGDIGYAVLAADLRDMTLAGPAKQAFADLWRAQKEGLAALERARGEQASLRTLANAARMLKGNPELMNLRVLQALAGKPGAPPPSVILGGASGLVPISREPAAAADEGEAPPA